MERSCVRSHHSGHLCYSTRHLVRPRRVNPARKARASEPCTAYETSGRDCRLLFLTSSPALARREGERRLVPYSFLIGFGTAGQKFAVVLPTRRRIGRHHPGMVGDDHTNKRLIADMFRRTSEFNHSQRLCNADHETSAHSCSGQPNRLFRFENAPPHLQVSFGSNLEPWLAERQHVLRTSTVLLRLRLTKRDQHESNHQRQSFHCGIPVRYETKICKALSHPSRCHFFFYETTFPRDSLASAVLESLSAIQASLLLWPFRPSNQHHFPALGFYELLAAHPLLAVFRLPGLSAPAMRYFHLGFCQFLSSAASYFECKYGLAPPLHEATCLGWRQLPQSPRTLPQLPRQMPERAC